jgi:death-on-curing protein
MVVAIHADQIRQHGGLHGIRDPAGLESALARARSRWSCESDVELEVLAASYGFGLTRSHPFVDGNKRTGFQVMYVFLGLNGCQIQATDEAVVRLMNDVASGSLTEAALAAWLADHKAKRRKR